MGIVSFFAEIKSTVILSTENIGQNDTSGEPNDVFVVDKSINETVSKDCKVRYVLMLSQSINNYNI